METLLAATLGTKDQVGSAPNGALLAFPIAEELHDGRGSTTTWVGLLLIALGLISALSASRIIRQAVLRRH